MAFFDKLNELAKGASEKVNSAIENTKLNAKISGEEKNISALTAKIGEYYLAKLDAGEVFDSEIMEIYASIGDSRALIENIKAEIALAQAAKEEAREAPADVSSIVCPVCGAENDSNSKFCKKCGAKLEAEPEVKSDSEEAEAVFCPVCGEKLDSEAKFCPKCGSKIG